MIILHRISTFFVGLVVAVGFILMIYFPFLSLGVIPAVLLLLFVLLARLNEWQVATYRFWNFVGTPIIFAFSGLALFLFFEGSTEKIIMGLVTALGVFLFAEHQFAYLHTPPLYKPYSLENLSLVLNVLTVFFLAAASNGLMIFLNIPLILTGLIFFILNLFVVYNMLWISKVEHSRAIAYALGGAVILSELYAAVSYLPISFYVSAAVITVFFYVYQGLCRAHLLDKLTRPIMVRYVSLGSIIALVVLSTAKWI